MPATRATRSAAIPNRAIRDAERSQQHFYERQQNDQGEETQERNDPLGRANGGKNKHAEDIADAARHGIEHAEHDTGRLP